MPKNKVSSYVGFAVKKGSALLGVDNVIESRRRAQVILFDEKLSERSQNRLSRYATDYGIPLYQFSPEEVLPSKNCLALGVTDPSLAQAIITAIKEIQQS